jgi:peptidoglycan/LPS O-acetylase OafA/YrhL
MADPARQRVAGLDGIRGPAAVFVVVNHIFLRAFPGYPWTGRRSGPPGSSTGGSRSSCSSCCPASRWRCRRRATGGGSTGLPVRLPAGQPAPDAKSVFVNGPLVQNVVGAPSPDRAFWSIAVEAQLYVVFPLLLLMVRRFRAIAMVGTVTIVVAAVGIVGPRVSGMDVFVVQSPPDLAALFAVGILCAGIVSASAARRLWPRAWIALAAAAPVLATIWSQGLVWTLDHLFWVDLTLGPAVGCLIAGLAAGHPVPLLRLLDTRPMRSLGSSSYSLYLTHGPIVIVVYDEIVAGRVHQGVPAFLVSFALAVPLTIVFARLFAAVFEIAFRQHRS